MRQADLAQEAGISASYLNLIEHDKRRIAGRLLGKIARALDTEPGTLSEGAERGLVDGLHHAASQWADGMAELAKAEDMAMRFPGWSTLITAQTARIAALEARAQVLTDRITYDPELATALHGVISAVTAIRSTASILTSDEELDAEWLQRFHRNIHDDAVRLAADSDALIAYLDPPEDSAGVPLSPLEEVERLLDETAWHLAECEAGGLPSGANLTPAAQRVFDGVVAQYCADAAVLPLDHFTATAQELGHDPWEIAAKTGADLDVVMRRLVHLPPGQGHPPMGLVVCDAGGFATLLRQVPGFAFPRGAACPLWPLYTALGQPGRPVRTDVVLPGQPETRLRCTAIATQKIAPGGDMPPLVQAVMLVQPDPPPGAGAVVPVGVSCRICPRDGCKARREPSSLGGGAA